MPFTPDQDQDLRRRHGFGRFGELPAAMYARLCELRELDLRHVSRETTIDLRLPRQRTRTELAAFAADFR
jgi:hypothetical protein